MSVLNMGAGGLLEMDVEIWKPEEGWMFRNMVA
jgi:hypothetical protein